MFPYFGVSGFSEPEQVLSLIGILGAKRRPRESSLGDVITEMDRLIHFGFRVNEKTLNRAHSNAEGYPDIFTIEKLLVRKKELPVKIRNTIHYSGNNVTIETLKSIARISPTNIHAIELISSWPAQNELLAFKKQHPEIHLILRINAQAFYEAGNTAQLLLRRIYTYEDAIDGIVFSPCDRPGTLALIEPFSDYFPAILSHFPEEICVAINGNLNTECIPNIRRAILSLKTMNLNTNRISIQTSYPKASPTLEIAKFLIMSAHTFKNPQ